MKKTLEEEIDFALNNLKDVIQHQELVKRITKGKGSTYEGSAAYKLGLNFGLVHVERIKEKFEEMKKGLDGTNH